MGVGAGEGEGEGVGGGGVGGGGVGGVGVGVGGVLGHSQLLVPQSQHFDMSGQNWPAFGLQHTPGPLQTLQIWSRWEEASADSTAIAMTHL